MTAWRMDSFGLRNVGGLDRMTAEASGTQQCGGWIPSVEGTFGSDGC